MEFSLGHLRCVDSYTLPHRIPPSDCFPLQVLRNIAGINPTTNERHAFEHGKNTVFAGAGPAKEMINQGVRVYEVAFWDPTSTEKLARTSRAASCPDFVDVVDNYTLLLHQGLIEQAFLREIENRRQYLEPEECIPSPVGGVFRTTGFVSCKTLDASHDELAKTHPVETVLENVETKQQFTVRSKYLFGCDGARSKVRICVAGGEKGDGEWKGKITMQGEATDIIWVRAAFWNTEPSANTRSVSAGRDGRTCPHRLPRYQVQVLDPLEGRWINHGHPQRSWPRTILCPATIRCRPQSTDAGYLH